MRALDGLGGGGGEHFFPVAMSPVTGDHRDLWVIDDGVADGLPPTDDHVDDAGWENLRDQPREFERG